MKFVRRYSYQPTIGLEVHARMVARQKLFSKASAMTNSPNKNVDLFDAAIPGTLPKLNLYCIELATRTAIALHSEISATTTFDRKHYFYPDLPNGYQITQFNYPFGRNGYFEFHNSRVGIEQIQIEQDSAKTVQGIGSGLLIDLNRAGVGILEIVTKPELHTSSETVLFLKNLQHLLWHIGVSHPDMDDGAFRCDVNVSVSKPGEPLGERVELKHLHKFSSIGLAIDYEIKRQTSLLESGKPVLPETRGFDLDTLKTFSLREKEHSHEYYFMPDANIPPIHISPKYIQKVKETMPEELNEQRRRLLNDYKLDADVVHVLMNKPFAVEYFEDTLKEAKNVDPKRVCNWIVIELFGYLNKESIDISSSPVDPIRMAGLISLVGSGQISQLQAKYVLGKMLVDERSALDIAKDHGLLLDANIDEISALCDQVIEQHPDVIQKIKNGKPKLIGFLIGQVVSKKKSANPKLVSDMFKQKLEE